jgi:hypothetical protein
MFVLRPPRLAATRSTYPLSRRAAGATKQTGVEEPGDDLLNVLRGVVVASMAGSSFGINALSASCYAILILH